MFLFQIFTLYALKEKKCPVTDVFTGKDVLNAISGGMVLEKAQMKCTYAIHPKAR